MKHPSNSAVQTWQEAGFALYVHWPFCESKCPYCDFNSHVTKTVDHQQWLRAFTSEIARVGAETKGRVLSSIFFGGGTPSLMAPETAGGIIDAAAKYWLFANDIEITLEANPSSVEAQKFLAFRHAGVNRISMGIQALNDGDLRRLGRKHSLREALAAISVAQNTFDRTSFDLIYARQDQTLGQWEVELRQALAMAGDHLSLYQLTIEPGTVFAARSAAGKLLGIPSEDVAADMYLLTQDICEAAGMPAYEVSNHAKINGHSRHNMTYWRGGDYAGVGPGAHGRLTAASGARLATFSHALPSEWLNTVHLDGTGEAPRETLTGAEQASELVMMGLRTDFGIDVNRLQSLSRNSLNMQRLAELIKSGHIRQEGNRIQATSAGRLLLNSIIRSLLI